MLIKREREIAPEAERSAAVASKWATRPDRWHAGRLSRARRRWWWWYRCRHRALSRSSSYGCSHPDRTKTWGHRLYRNCGCVAAVAAVAVAVVAVAAVRCCVRSCLQCHRWGCRGRVAGNLCLDEGCGHDEVTRNVDATRSADMTRGADTTRSADTTSGHRCDKGMEGNKG